MTIRRPWALPLVPLYGLSVGVKNWLYDIGLAKVRQLRKPVISVGSLSAGGAGKTPLVIALAELLERHGMEADVLSRGYGRKSNLVEEVDGGGSAARFGDEPLEMARSGLRVFVATERHEAGLLAERVCNAWVHLLDDGFQHRRLARDLNLVLVTSGDLEDALLPAGNLREGLSGLNRADVIVMLEEESGSPFEDSGAAKVWLIRRKLEVPSDKPERPLAFCGIARPAQFFSMLVSAGWELAGKVEFPDHHAFTSVDIERLVEAARLTGANGFVTTAKDAVKILPEAMRLLEVHGPVWVAKLRVSFVDETALMATLRRVLTK